jgi:hypothetical protein
MGLASFFQFHRNRFWKYRLVHSVGLAVHEPSNSVVVVFSPRPSPQRPGQGFSGWSRGPGPVPTTTVTVTFVSGVKDIISDREENTS